MVVQNNRDPTFNFTFTPVYQSGVYYDKNIKVNVLFLDVDTIKITIFIFN